MEIALKDKQELNQANVKSIMDKINISDYSNVMSFGVKPMTEIANFSDSLLSDVKVRDNREVGNQLQALVSKVKEYNPLTNEEEVKSWLSKVPFLNLLVKKTEQINIDHSTLTEQVDTIASNLESSMVGLIKNNNGLDKLYGKNIEYYNELNEFITAGKAKLDEIKYGELKELQDKADETQDLMDIQRVKDKIDDINRFERRIHDLEISKSVAMQTAPQIRIIQNNNQQLAEKIQGSILTTLPIWKSQIVLSKSLNEQERAVKLQQDVSDTTNKLLMRNAEILQMNSVATAREAERAIVDVDTLREVQNKLVSTIEETMKIAVEGRERRKAVEIELAGMEENLREKITSTINRYSENPNVGRTFDAEFVKVSD